MTSARQLPPYRHPSAHLQPLQRARIHVRP